MSDHVTLYHFTNREALTDILLDGQIRPSGKSLDRAGDGFYPANNAPDIVWLTTDPTPGWCCEQRGGVEPYAVRFTLRLPAAEVEDVWVWLRRHRMYPDHFPAQPGHAADERRRFRCIERPVLAHTEWVAIDHMHEAGLCAAPWWDRFDTPEYRAQLADRQTDTRMDPLDIVYGIQFLVALRDALRKEADNLVRKTTTREGEGGSESLSPTPRKRGHTWPSLSCIEKTPMQRLKHKSS